MIRILIADDHAIFRSGLREILAREFKDVICAEAENACQVSIQLLAQNWDLVILDITMPGPSGLDVLADLIRLEPSFPCWS